MCDSMDPFGAEEEVNQKLAELFKSWTNYILEFLVNDEEIRSYEWIETFFSDIRIMLLELRNRSEYSDSFKVKYNFDKNPKVFEIKCSGPVS